MPSPGSLGRTTVALQASWTFLPATHSAMPLPAASSGHVPLPPPNKPKPPVDFKWSITGFVDASGSAISSFPVAGIGYGAVKGDYPYLNGTNLSTTIPVSVTVDGGTPSTSPGVGIFSTDSTDTQLAIANIPPAPGGKAGTYPLTVINFDSDKTAHPKTFTKMITYE